MQDVMNGIAKQIDNNNTTLQINQTKKDEQKYVQQNELKEYIDTEIQKSIKKNIDNLQKELEFLKELILQQSTSNKQSNLDKKYFFGLVILSIIFAFFLSFIQN